MGKKLVVLSGSPRRKGNGARMVDALVAAAEAKGIETIRFDVAGMKIGGCNACDQCFKSPNAACALSDDFNKIAAALEEADAIVFASPLYWYSFSSQLKEAIDKLYSFCLAGKDFGWKPTALIGTCEEGTVDAFNGMVFAFEKSAALLKLKIVDKVLVPGVGGIGAIEKTDGEARAAALVDKLF